MGIGGDSTNFLLKTQEKGFYRIQLPGLIQENPLWFLVSEARARWRVKADLGSTDF